MFDYHLYKKALDFAAEAHKNQLYPGTDWTYLVHLTKVYTEVILAIPNENKFDANILVQLALLHDVIEDTDKTFDDIVVLFGKNVANGVMALTKNPDLPKDKQMQDSLKRIKSSYIEVSIVKLADRIANLDAPPIYWNREKIMKYYEESLYIKKKLACSSNYMRKRLNSKLTDYQKYIR